MRQRVIGYIDGFNLYHGLREAGLRRYYWVDVGTLCRLLLKPDQELVHTKYSTSRIATPRDKVKRQTTFIEAMQTLPNLTVYFGQYDAEEFRCDQCGRVATWHNETMTDVNIAIQMAKDAYADRFDVALLVTGDADQTPTIQMIREGFPNKRVICAFPPRRVSQLLRRFAHGFLHINENVLAASQLPPVVVKADGYRLSKPEEWR